MKLRIFISRLQELIAYLADFPLDTEGKESSPLPADEIIDIIYHSMPTMWKNKMIEQGFHFTDPTIKEITEFFKIRVESLKPKEEEKKSSAAVKKTKKKRKRADSNSSASAVEASEESTVKRIQNRKCCILHSKCSHSISQTNSLWQFIFYFAFATFHFVFAI